MSGEERVHAYEAGISDSMRIRKERAGQEYGFEHLVALTVPLLRDLKLTPELEARFLLVVANFCDELRKNPAVLPVLVSDVQGLTERELLVRLLSRSPDRPGNQSEGDV